MTGGIIPDCAACNDLGKDPNGCPKCGKLGPMARKKRDNPQVKGGSRPKKKPGGGKK